MNDDDKLDYDSKQVKLEGKVGKWVTNLPKHEGMAVEAFDPVVKP